MDENKNVINPEDAIEGVSVNPNEIKPLDTERIPTEAEIKMMKVVGRIMGMIKRGSRQERSSKHTHIAKSPDKKLAHKRNRLAMTNKSRKANHGTKGHTAVKRRA